MSTQWTVSGDEFVDEAIALVQHVNRLLRSACAATDGARTMQVRVAQALTLGLLDELHDMGRHSGVPEGDVQAGMASIILPSPRPVHTFESHIARSSP